MHENELSGKIIGSAIEVHERLDSSGYKQSERINIYNSAALSEVSVSAL